MTEAALVDIDVSDRTIGANIRRYREQRGLSQAQIAEALGVSHQAVHKYETGETRVAATTLLACARALLVPVELFFAGLDEIEGEIEPYALALIRRTAGEIASIPEPYRTQIIGIVRALKGVFERAAA